jgi:hypothetical protein
MIFVALARTANAVSTAKVRLCSQAPASRTAFVWYPVQGWQPAATDAVSAFSFGVSRLASMLGFLSVGTRKGTKQIQGCCLSDPARGVYVGGSAFEEGLETLTGAVVPSVEPA